MSEIERVRGECNAARNEAGKWQRQVELFEVRLAALERAAQLRPLRVEISRLRGDGTVTKGRQPGAISKVWRGILVTIGQSCPDGAGDDAIADIARRSGLANIRPKDVRDRMHNYEQHGYVEPAVDGWRVTKQALARFGADSVDQGSESEEDDLDDAA